MAGTTATCAAKYEAFDKVLDEYNAGRIEIDAVVDQYIVILLTFQSERYTQ